jgi:hypothetical protein
MSTVLINGGTLKESESITGFDNNSGGILKNTDPELILTPKSGIIDVVNNFNWYSGPKATTAALNKVPRAFLTERRQELNSLLSGALYYLNVIGRSASDVTPNAVKSVLATINEKVGVVKTATRSFRDFADKFASGGDKAILQRNNLLSLVGIYYTQPTGFTYTLPYYNNMMDVGSSWGSSEQGPFTGLINKGMEIVDEMSRITNITQPGVYIEKPKYYNFEDNGKTISLNFPLFNTIRRGTTPPHQMNYELLWLLSFQNKPYKTSFARTPPPKIYTVEIPGVCSLPYAYISNMSIDFRGTVRRLPVSIPNAKGNITTATVPIPDAYVVNISFTSLLNDYANQMIGAGFSTRVSGNSVTIGS